MFDQPSPMRREEWPQRLLTDRLFFAIFPDAVTAARIARLREALYLELGLRGKPLATERLHATLHHVGDYAGLPLDIVASAGDAASAVAMPPFTVAFDGAESFRGRPGHRPFVLRGEDGVADRRVDTVSWAVHEFVLVHSLLGRSRYNVLARFPLRAQA